MVDRQFNVRKRKSKRPCPGRFEGAAGWRKLPRLL